MGMGAWVRFPFTLATPRARAAAPPCRQVSWRRHESYDTAEPPDVFVAWRYPISAFLGLGLHYGGGGGGDVGGGVGGGVGAAGAGKVFVWLQDVPSRASYTPGFTGRLAGIFTLSAFHARMLPAHARAAARTITPNGLDPGHFAAPGVNSPLR